MVKKQFSYDCTDEPLHDAENHFRVIFLNTVVHTAIVSLNERLEQLYECFNIVSVSCDVKQYKSGKHKF
jgi:hypothetical protein